MNWKSELIEPDRPPPDGIHAPVVFRRQHDLKGPAVTAQLYITAHGVYEASLNGSVIGDHVLAPGWTSYNHRLAYQTFDVLEHLRDHGSCSIEVTVAEGWYCGRLGFEGGRRNIYGPSLGLVAQLQIAYADGHEDIIATDNSWCWARSPILESSLYDGEIHDARIADVDKNPVRSLPLPRGLFSAISPPVLRTAELPVKEVSRTPSGKHVLDFGQNFAGRVRLRVSGPAGTTITLHHAEVLDQGELAKRPLRGAKCTDTLILAGGAMEWEPKFTFHGFRYVQVDGWPGEMQADDFTGIVLHTDMKRTGFFECSNPMLNKLHQNIVWSMRSNFLSIPTDCPQRDERFGWTGDIAVFSETANFLYDTQSLLLNWLEDLYAEQLANEYKGVVPLTVPNVVEGLEKDAHAIWGDASIMVPWSLFNATGDVSLLNEGQYNSAKAWLEAIPRRCNGLWNYTAQWKLGDWLDPAAKPDDPGNTTTDPEFVSNVFLIHVTDIMSKICAVLGRPGEEALHASKATSLRQAFANEYITKSGRLSPDTQTAYVLAVHFDILRDKTHMATAAKRLEDLICRGSRFCIATGFAGTPYIGHALRKLGLTSLFYRMLLHRICPSWLYPITMGATTIWERWDSMLPDGSVNPGEMTSFNHYALGSVADWMHKVILGLRPLQPGWSEVLVAPVPGGGLKWARGQYITKSGPIKVAWRIEGEKTFYLSVSVPLHVTATVKLPFSGKVGSLQSGEWTWGEPYVKDPSWPPIALDPPHVVTPPLAEDPVLPFPEKPLEFDAGD